MVRALQKAVPDTWMELGVGLRNMTDQQWVEFGLALMRTTNYLPPSLEVTLPREETKETSGPCNGNTSYGDSTTHLLHTQRMAQYWGRRKKAVQRGALNFTWWCHSLREPVFSHSAPSGTD